MLESQPNATEAASTSYWGWLFKYAKTCSIWLIMYMFGYYKASFSWLMVPLLFVLLRDKRAKEKKAKFDNAKYISNADEKEIIQEFQKFSSLSSRVASLQEQLKEKAKGNEGTSQQVKDEEFLTDFEKEKKDKDKLPKEFANMKSQLISSSTQVSNLSEEISILKEKLKEASSQLTESKSQLISSSTQTSNLSEELSILKEKLKETSSQLTGSKEKITALELSKKNLEAELSAKNSAISDTVKQLTDLNTQLEEKDMQIKNLEIKRSDLECSLKTDIVCQTKAVSANKVLQDAQDKYQHEKQVLQDKVTTLERNVSNASLAANESACQIAAPETKISSLEEINKKIEDQVSESLSQSTDSVQQVTNLNTQLQDKPDSESDKLTEDEDLSGSDDLFGSDDDWVPSQETPKPASAPTRSTRNTRSKSHKKKDDIFNPHLDQENKNKEKVLLINKEKSKNALTRLVLQEPNNIANPHINSKNSSSILASKAEAFQESGHDFQNSSSKTSETGVKSGKQKRRLYKPNVDEPFECEPNMIELPVVSPHSVVRRQLRTKKK